MKIIAKNKKASFNYELLSKIEAGIILLGSEVKGIKAGNISIKEAFVSIKNGKVFLKQAHITIPSYANQTVVDATKDRILLLKKSEITKLEKEISLNNGLTIVPTLVYISDRGYIKVEIALARGKKLHDKRETIKKRDIERRG